MKYRGLIMFKEMNLVLSDMTLVYFLVGNI